MSVPTLKEPQITAFEDFARMDKSSHCDWPPVSLQWKIDLSASRPNLRRARGDSEQLQTRLARRDPSYRVLYVLSDASQLDVAVVVIAMSSN